MRRALAVSSIVGCAIVTTSCATILLDTDGLTRDRDRDSTDGSGIVDAWAAPQLRPDAPDGKPPCTFTDPTNGRCYRYFARLKTWPAAEDECVALGGHLAAITTMPEWELVNASTATMGNFWIGGQDIAVEGAFVWGSGEPFGAFTNWKSGEPNNHHDAEDCVIMEPLGSGGWNDSACTDLLAYLCEE